jgi:hypothetical protein
MRQAAAMRSRLCAAAGLLIHLLLCRTSGGAPATTPLSSNPLAALMQPMDCAYGADGAGWRSTWAGRPGSRAGGAGSRAGGASSRAGGASRTEQNGRSGQNGAGGAKQPDRIALFMTLVRFRRRGGAGASGAVAHRPALSGAVPHRPRKSRAHPAASRHARTRNHNVIAGASVAGRGRLAGPAGPTAAGGAGASVAGRRQPAGPGQAGGAGKHGS